LALDVSLWFCFFITGICLDDIHFWNLSFEDCDLIAKSFATEDQHLTKVCILDRPVQKRYC